MDHSSGLVFRRPQAASHRRAVVYFCSAVLTHHEPIFARQLVEDHERILEVTGWMSPGARAWVEGRSRVPVLLGASNQATAVAG